jgi:hypothetical protein
MKANVTVSFSLGTTIEPEVNDYHWDSGSVTDFKGESYFSAESFTVQGGSLTFTVEDDSFTDEDDVKEWVRSEVINDDNEVEDSNGITWVVEELDIEVEIEEAPLPTLEEAIQTLGTFAEERRNDEEWGEIARAAIVVLDTLGTVEARVSSLEARLEEQSQRIEGLVAQINKANEEASPF